MTTIRPDLRVSAAILVGLVVMTATVAFVARDLLSVVMVGLALVLAWWSWPGRVGNHTSNADAIDQAGPDDVLVYWRPG